MRTEVNEVNVVWQNIRTMGSKLDLRQCAQVIEIG
jgi:hypothetical protein